MRIKKKIFIVLFLHTLSVFSFPIPSNWFEEFQLSNKSKIYRQIQFSQIQDKKKFIFYELSFNETRKWEELRIQGELEINLETLILKVETCALYGKKDIQKRWALLKSFDCKHLEWEGNLNNNILFLREKNESFEDFYLKQVSKNGNVILKIIEQTESYTLGWGIDAKKSYRSKFGQTLDNLKKIPILSVRESIVFFSPYSETIDFLQISLPKQQ